MSRITDSLPVTKFQDLGAVLSLLAADMVEKKLGSETRCVCQLQSWGIFLCMEPNEFIALTGNECQVFGRLLDWLVLSVLI